MRNCIISIGRNVGDKPMSSERWAAFKLDVCSFFPVRYFTGTGVGCYDGANEESFTVIAPEPAHTGLLRAALQSLARQYGQECIALTLATPELIGPDSCLFCEGQGRHGN